MTLLIVSHSYVSEENRKNIAALRQYLPVRVVVPDSFKSSIFRKVVSRGESGLRDCVRALKAYHLPRSQYLLLPLTLGLRGEPADVINVEYDPWSVMYWQVLTARRFAARPPKIVCTIKNNTYTAYRGLLGWAKRVLALRGITTVDLFVACSQRTADLYHQRFAVPWRKLVVCYHLGVDVDLFRPSEKKRTGRSDGRLTVGYCGRFDQDKGVMELIEAVNVCRDRTCVPLELHLLGTGALMSQLQRLAVSHRWLRLFSPVSHSEVPRFLEALDIFVLPSCVLPGREEHDAHALAEAMAMGLPCIGTTSGIIPEMLSDGSGFVVEANSSAAISDAIVPLVGDSELRLTMGRRARTRAVECFGLAALARKKAQIFTRLVETRESARESNRALVEC